VTLFRNFTLIVSIFLSFSSSFAIERVNVDTESLQELIETIGLAEQAKTALTFRQEMLRSQIAAGKLTTVEAELQSRLVDKAFDVQYILDFLADISMQHAKVPYQHLADEMLGEYKTPLFKKIVAMENQFTTLEGQRKIQELYLKPLEQQASKQRIDCVNRLIVNSPVVFGNYGQLYINNRVTLTLSMFPAQELPSEPKALPHLQKWSAKHAVLTAMLYVYRDLSDDELRVYANSINKYRDVHRYLFSSFNWAMQNCRSRVESFLADEYLTLTGFRDQIRKTPEYLKYGMQEAVSMELEEAENMAEAIPYVEFAYHETFMSGIMTRKLNVSFKKHKAALDWYQSELGRKVVERENWATSIEGHLAIQQASLKPLSSQSDQSRIALIKKLNAEYSRRGANLYIDTGVPLNNRIGMNLWLAGRFKGTRFGAVAISDRGIDPHTFPTPAARMHYILSGMIQAYNSLTDAELERYIQFISHNSDYKELVNNYNEALLQSRGMLIVEMELGPDPEPDLTDPSELRALLLDYGVIENKTLYAKGSDATNIGSVSVVRDPVFTQTTDQITTKLGRRFGMSYVVKGGQHGRSSSLRIRITHPPITNPQNGHMTEVDSWDTPFVFGQKSMDGWIFEYPWEMVPGNWKIEVLSGEDVLLAKVFTVADPAVNAIKPKEKK
jgi:hypothetical protein